MKKYILFVLFVISMTGNVYAADIENAINTAIDRYETEVNIDEVDDDELAKGLTDYFAKNANAGLISEDLYAFDRDKNGKYDTLNINYLYTDEENKEIQAFIEKKENDILATTKSLPNADKVKAIYKFFCSRFQYDEHLHYDIKHLYEENTGTCCSFSIAFKRMMDKCNIPCNIVVSSDGNHEWNEVFIDNEWRNIDITYGTNLYNTKFPNAEMRGYLLSDNMLKNLGYNF
ncbi:MAG TPA: hypothetical protein DCG28_01720 [Lachnospiraceae bacterium]|nr:hypothetical protein [Lachnospiraceae bacterium]